MSLRVAKILRFTAVASKAAPPQAFAELSVSSIELFDSLAAGVSIAMPGASGRENLAIGWGSVCASAKRPVEANNATVARRRFLSRSFFAVSRARAIVKNNPLITCRIFPRFESYVRVVGRGLSWAMPIYNGRIKLTASCPGADLVWCVAWLPHRHVRAIARDER